MQLLFLVCIGLAAIVGTCVFFFTCYMLLQSKGFSNNSEGYVTGHVLLGSGSPFCLVSETPDEISPQGVITAKFLVGVDNLEDHPVGSHIAFNATIPSKGRPPVLGRVFHKKS